jgi:hypothetical protein
MSSIMTANSRNSVSSVHWSALIGALAGGVYLVMCPHVSGDGDSSELTLVLALNGVAHPTGYPLYTVAGHYFALALHQIGVSWQFAANAWSALGGAIAIALMHAVSVRLVPPQSALAKFAPLLALCPIAIFMFNPWWTGVTTVAEVYSWHQAWVMAAILTFVTYVQRPFTAPPYVRHGGVCWSVLGSLIT